MGLWNWSWVHSWRKSWEQMLLDTATPSLGSITIIFYGMCLPSCTSRACHHAVSSTVNHQWFLSTIAFLRDQDRGVAASHKVCSWSTDRLHRPFHWASPPIVNLTAVAVPMLCQPCRFYVCSIPTPFYSLRRSIRILEDSLSSLYIANDSFAFRHGTMWFSRNSSSPCITLSSFLSVLPSF